MARWSPVEALLLGVVVQGVASAYYGIKIGAITTYNHGVTGNVSAAAEDAIIITGLNYDGRGPDAYFWAGNKGELEEESGDQLPDEAGSSKVLGSYKDSTVYLKLPKKITEYKSFGIFCKKFKADFGNVKLPVGFQLPKEQSIGKLITKQPSTTATDVILKDSATVLLKDFEYDGSCTDSAFFVAAPTSQAKPEELTHLIYGNGKTTALERHDKVDVNVTLPEGHHWNEFEWFAVYCVSKKESFADITVNKGLAESVPVHNPKTLNKVTGSPGVASLLGPLSALSLFTWSVAAMVAAIVVRQCLDGYDPVESC
ncbi:protein Skeletor, isoforms B/C-like isoform X1 [Dermacentor albipictus]|uniref:protein Skeletor, isoforms B/C-like isoform X1 n=1 Tax=Dermacentor albipictus TaxID=60249 RepID=UPI0038FCE208